MTTQRFNPRGPRKSSNEPAKCGTLRGYKKHRAHGEEACDPCKAANAKNAADKREAIRTGAHVPKRREPAKCGTRSGYNRHVKRHEPVCDACRDAYNTEQRDAHARREEARHEERAEHQDR